MAYRRYNQAKGTFWGIGLSFYSSVEIRWTDGKPTLAINPPDSRQPFRPGGYLASAGKQTFVSDKWSLWWILSFLVDPGSSLIVTRTSSLVRSTLRSQSQRIQLGLQLSASLELTYSVNRRLSLFGRIRVLSLGTYGAYSISRESEETDNAATREWQYRYYAYGSPTSLSVGSLGLRYRF
ncbi:MAG: hypothetical protein ACE5LH_01545 [Fidelibacterota bacterium]